jgi:tight adherence protein C
MINAIAIAFIVFAGYLLVDKYIVYQRQRNTIRQRLNLDGTVVDAPEEGLYQYDRTPSPRARQLAGLLRLIGVDVTSATAKLERQFGRAGMATVDGPIYYVFFQYYGAVLCGLLALALMSAGGLLNLTLGLFIGVLGVLGPKLFLQNAIEKRKKILTRAFPDTLDLLLICVESGLALDASLNRVCSELGKAYPEMTAELNRTRLELALLNDRTKALMNLAERTDVVAFRALVASLIQSEKFGTSLSDTLRVLSEDFRLQRISIAEAKAARLPVLMTIPLIFLLMPAFMLIILGPAIISFMRQGSALTGG